MKLPDVELFRFLIVGIIATLCDWGAFYVLAYPLNVHYGPAFIIALVVGALINYASNKKFTFRCTSRKVPHQFGVFFILMMMSLLIGMHVMGVLVEWFNAEAFFARIMTTGIMFFPNYLMHRYVTFNKNRWKQE